MYERLKSYKNVHSDCLVPWGYKDDPELSGWVIAQRNLGFKKLGPERFAKLNSIGFVWNAAP